jgi:hypothetical protein
VTTWFSSIKKPVPTRPSSQVVVSTRTTPPLTSSKRSATVLTEVVVSVASVMVVSVVEDGVEVVVCGSDEVPLQAAIKERENIAPANLSMCLVWQGLHLKSSNGFE